MVPVVFVQCSIYNFIPNKSYAHLLNVEPSYSVTLENYNTKFDDIALRFTDQNSRQLKMKRQN